MNDWSHAGISADNIRYLANQCDTLLRPHFKTAAGDDSAKNKETNSSLQAYGTGEEQQAAIIASCDDLVKQLHKAVAASDSLHLTINSVHGISPVFRYTEVNISLLNCLLYGFNSLVLILKKWQRKKQQQILMFDRHYWNLSEERYRDSVFTMALYITLHWNIFIALISNIAYYIIYDLKMSTWKI